MTRRIDGQLKRIPVIMKKLGLILGVILGFCCTAVGEDQLLLKNGEVLKGTYLKIEDGKVYFRSSSFGELAVAQADAKLVKGTDVAKGEAAPAALMPGHATAPVRLDAKQGERAERKKGWARRVLHLPDDMQMQLGVGLGLIEGQNTSENFSTTLSAQYDRERYFNSAGAEYQYGEVNGFVNMDRFEFKMRNVRYFGDLEDRRYFALVQNVYEHDAVRLINYDYDIYTGLGVDALNNEKFRLRIAGGADFEWKDFNGSTRHRIADFPAEQRVNAFVYEDFQWHFGKRLKFAQSFLYAVDPKETGYFDLRITAGVQTKITQATSLLLNYQFDFDSASIPGLEEEAARVTLQLGYTF
ncbi:DUF481 domain-containing protein [Verrucomicrobia bacterium]|nr:DUF481 domain-containing protein [Verrucomicrobiota bacterium]